MTACSCPLDACRVAAEGFRDRLEAAPLPQQAQGGVPHGGQHLRAAPPAHPAGVFPQRHVAHVMRPVLDRPVAAHPAQQLRRVGPGPRHAGDEVAHLPRRLAVPRHLGLHPADLGHVGPVQVVGQPGRRPQRPLLAAAVALVVGRDLVKGFRPQPPPPRGKKPPGLRRPGPSGCRAAASVGCP